MSGFCEHLLKNLVKLAMPGRSCQSFSIILPSTLFECLERGETGSGGTASVPSSTTKEPGATRCKKFKSFDSN